MTQRVIVIGNILEPEGGDRRDVEEVEVDDIRDYLMGRFNGRWRPRTKIYLGQAARNRDITPLDAEDFRKLGELEGPFYVVEFPGTPDFGIGEIIAAVIASLLVAAATFFLIPRPSLGNLTNQSANNELSGRQNKARPLQRIPDILGEVRSTPDLIGLPYKVFEVINNVAVEVEYSAGCITRGACETSDHRDDQTPLTNIQGTSLEIYGPDTSPLSGDDPELLIGDAIEQDLVVVKASTAINGQTLYAPNYKSLTGLSNIFFKSDNTIRQERVDGEFPFDFTDYFEAGDVFSITNGTVNALDFSGSGYVISTVTATVITLTSPSSINANWGGPLAGLPSGETDQFSPTMQVENVDRTIGPFVLDDPNIEEVWINIVALGNLYKSNGNTQIPVTVTFEVTVQHVDQSLTTDQPAETFSFSMKGSSVDKSTLGKTEKFTPAHTGRCQVSIVRTTDTDLSFSGTVQDECKWRDLYGVSSVGVTDFGNVTTFYSRTVANTSSLSLKERKLNMLVVRKVSVHNDDGTFGPALAASKRADDIFCFAAMDPYIGGRALSELDVDQIYAEIADVESTFGTVAAIEFGHTFDDDSTSYEETLEAIAQAVFCTGLRRGSVIQLHHEKQTADSTVLFNHRNILPGSEKRVLRFGNLDNYDGVEIQYADAANYDAPATYRIPNDGSAIKPQKQQLIGPRNFSQVYWQAWRAYQKIIYQHVSTEIIATDEASLLSRLERILIADSTRAKTQAGEVVSQDGLTLTLDDEVTFADGKTYTIFLQLPDGTIDTIVVTAGAESDEVYLAEAPSSDLSLDPDNTARAKYWIVSDDDGREQAFLVSEVEQNDKLTHRLAAVNYDDRYYLKDGPVPGYLDFSNGRESGWLGAI